MGGVFANNLEISGKSVQAQTIAAFPDVCMTPPESPATPPGVPVPYPNFAMASDTEKGTGKVKIKDKEVNLKNKSDMKKTSGDEAGCAAKKGVITSKNTGKAYFNAWSPNVKFEGKPVVRMSDVTTNNHASPVGNSPPWPHIASINPSNIDCATVLAEFEVHRHGDKACEDGHESEHFMQNEYMQWERGKKTATWLENYKTNDAPCICMQAYKKKPGGGYQSGTGSKEGSPHHKKTMRCNNAIKKRTKTPTVGEMLKECVAATVAEDPRAKNKTDKEKEEIGECLEAVFMDYMERAAKEKDPSATKEDIADQPIAWEVNSDTSKMWVWE